MSIFLLNLPLDLTKRLIAYNAKSTLTKEKNI